MLGGIHAGASELQLEARAGNEGKSKWLTGIFALTALTAE
jgi:hypothetical protein